MLVQFMIKNVLSFKEETILDMTAINAYKEHESNLIDIGTKEKFLKVAAIYGANASGKSNFYLAMTYFQNIIKKSLDSVEVGEESIISSYYYPFSFDAEEENSEFEITVIIDHFEYRYGFEYNAKCIVTEWMYRKNIETNRTSTIFERTTHSVKFGPPVRKECDKYKEHISPEILVLSFFYKLKLKTDIFKTVYLGIMSTAMAPPNFGENEQILATILPSFIDNEKHNLLAFLSAIDTGIVDIYYEEREKSKEFYTVHVGRDDNKYTLLLTNESDGTIKSIILYIFVQIAILNNKCIFVDEINIKLHPLLLKFIVDLFYTENSQAQLIYTTHDTTLMDKKFFRRDQIWFVQKDEFGYSELSALSDFKVRSDASFERDYLAGVYGGIPLIKEFEMKEGE